MELVWGDVLLKVLFFIPNLAHGLSLIHIYRVKRKIIKMFRYSEMHVIQGMIRLLRKRCPNVKKPKEISEVLLKLNRKEGESHV